MLGRFLKKDPKNTKNTNPNQTFLFQFVLLRENRIPEIAVNYRLNHFIIK